MEKVYTKKQIEDVQDFLWWCPHNILGITYTQEVNNKQTHTKQNYDTICLINKAKPIPLKGEEAQSGTQATHKECQEVAATHKWEHQSLHYAFSREKGENSNFVVLSITIYFLYCFLSLCTFANFSLVPFLTDSHISYHATLSRNPHEPQNEFGAAVV